MKMLVLILLFCTSTCFGQGKLEPGYLITTDGERIDCYVENKDWTTYSKKVTYLDKENSSYHRISIDDIREFGIGNEPKFVRAEVDIDKSSTVSRFNSISTQRAPHLKKKNKAVFLNVVVAGQATLYVYHGGGVKLFYYKIGEHGPIELLVHKIYRETTNNNNTRMRRNNRFRQQLKSQLICAESRFDNLRYIKKDLKKIFVQYNECMGKAGS